MIDVRKRFPPPGCCCLNNKNKTSDKVFRKTNKARGMKASGVALATIGALTLTIVISTTLHKTLLSSPSKSPNRANTAEAIKAFVNSENIRVTLHNLTKKPHVAGTENNLRVAEIIRDQMVNQGLEGVHFNEYNVLLSYPDWNTPNSVEILGEDGQTVHKTSGRSISVLKEEQSDPTAEIQWLAYSADGVAEGEVVYVNRLNVKDIEHLESQGINLTGKIFLARYSSNFRGNVAMMAVKKGAIGCLLFSDPSQVASLGTGPNETYGKTDKMPPSAVQRGGVYLGMGDPRTPAFPSIGDLYKEKSEEELYAQEMMPTIPILPIPYSDARILFDNMKGDQAVSDFQGSLNVTYRYGPGLINNQRLRMTVHAKNEERKIQNVLGFIKGSVEPEKYVILSNHYDAWTYGAIDPNSGTSTLLEVSRALKAYQKSTGWAPARSILFAHWDAEEYGLIGSTEFAEEHRLQLMRRAVAVINMDCIGGNQTLLGLANPTVAGVLRDAASKTAQPNSDEQKQGRKTLYESWKHFAPPKDNRTEHPYMRIPGGGSDHMPFFDYLGIPIIFFITSSLDAPPTYPLYHTIYETPYLTEKILDPQFKMHQAVAEMFIEMALKFSDSKILPYKLDELMSDVNFDYLPKIQQHFDKADSEGNLTAYLKPGLKQFKLLQETVSELTRIVGKRNATRMEDLPMRLRTDENNRLIEFEKCFINPHGAAGNPQARHVLFHPSATNWYDGSAIAQVHDMITNIETSSDEKKLQKYSRRLAKEIALVNVAFICAKHTLSDIFYM